MDELYKIKAGGNMRKTIVLLTLFILFGFCINTIDVYASSFNNENNVVQLRAGGGGSSGGTGGSFSSGTHGHGSSGYYCNYNNQFLCAIHNIFSWIVFISISFVGVIVLYVKVLRSSFNSKKYMRMLSKKDIAWKYKDIERQVIKTFYVVQESWSNMDMEPAKQYMSKDLYESYKGKLEWMEIGNKRNVLKRIRLINLKPVSIHDDENDDKDLVWFYINGSMVDYIIDTMTNKSIDGNRFFSKPFIEFWEFTRKGDKWVLSQILQSNESDKINFQ